ncbi:MAG: Mut7-C RNAse domain-containing protein [Candidatus Dormibacteraceae bacterium]
MRLRFAADANVGRLARWLRVLGYDATYRPHVRDADLVRQALAEGRVLLTRDADLMHRRVITSGRLPALLVEHDLVEDQLRQVSARLRLDTALALTRCLECNLELEARAPEAVAARVPSHVRRTQSRYSECPLCRRVYWSGTHRTGMRRVLAGLG